MRERSTPPARPYIPITLALFLVFWVAIRAGFTLLTFANKQLAVFTLLGFAAIIVSALVLKQYTAGLLFVAALMLGTLFGLQTAQVQKDLQEELAFSPYRSCYAVVIEDPKPAIKGHKGKLKLYDAEGFLGVAEGAFGPELIVPVYGEQLKVSGYYKPYGSDEYGVSRLSEGILGTFKVHECSSGGFSRGFIGKLQQKRAAFTQLVGPEQAACNALIAGVASGNGSMLKVHGIRDTFSQTGLSHLVAVSGSHLATVTALLYVVFHKVRMPLWARIILIALITFGYLAFTAFQPSAIRSWIMSLCVLVAPLVKRRRSSLTALSLAGMSMLAINPQTAFSLSFTLSVFSVLALIVFSPLVMWWLMYWLPLNLPHRVTVLFQTIALTLCAQVATLPLTLPKFHVFSLVAPLANLLVSPLVASLLVLGLLGGGLALVIPSAAGVLMMPAQLLATLILWLSGVLANLPVSYLELMVSGVVLSVVVVILLVFLWVVWPVKPKPVPVWMRMGLVAGLLVYVVGGWYSTPPGLIALDIGQGDAILVRGKKQKILVDVGDDNNNIKRALLRNRIRHLDGVVLTHLDKDHVGGMKNLAQTASVTTVYVAQGVIDNLPEELLDAIVESGAQRVVELVKDDVLLVDAYELQVIWPQQPVKGDKNQDSLCFKLTCDNFYRDQQLTAFLSGDAEIDTNDALLRQGLIGNIDVLKVGHHGARVSINAEQAERMHPSVALISCGKHNRYGHPTDECLAALSSIHAKILRTDISGDVGVVVRPWGIELLGDTPKAPGCVSSRARQQA